MSELSQKLPEWCRATVEDFFENGHLTEKDASQPLSPQQTEETLDELTAQFRQLQDLDESERDLILGEEGALALEFGGMSLEAYFEGDEQNGWVCFTLGSGDTVTVAVSRFGPDLVDLVTLNKAFGGGVPHARALRLRRTGEGSYAELRGRVVDPWVALSL